MSRRWLNLTLDGRYPAVGFVSSLFARKNPFSSIQSDLYLCTPLYLQYLYNCTPFQSTNPACTHFIFAIPLLLHAFWVHGGCAKIQFRLYCNVGICTGNKSQSVGHWPRDMLLRDSDTLHFCLHLKFRSVVTCDEMASLETICVPADSHVAPCWFHPCTVILFLIIRSRTGNISR